MSGPNATRQPTSAESSTGISMTIPRTRSGARWPTSSAVLAPSEVPTITASPTARWSSSPTTCSAKSVVE